MNCFFYSLSLVSRDSALSKLETNVKRQQHRNFDVDRNRNNRLGCFIFCIKSGTVDEAEAEMANAEGRNEASS